MKKRLKVCFCGWPGTGTSSAAKELREALKAVGIEVEIVSSGGVFRRLAIDRYRELSETEALAQLEVDAGSDSSVDSYVDGQTLTAIRSDTDVIFDSRVAPHFVKVVRREQPKAFNGYFVYLHCKPWTSAERVAARSNEVEIDKVTPEMRLKASKDNRHRIVKAGGRYKTFYGVGPLRSQVEQWDQKFNTDKISTEALVQVVINDLRSRGWLD